MSEVRRSRCAGRKKAWKLRLLSSVALGASYFIVAGCASSQPATPRPADYDPLLGGPPSRPAVKAAAAASPGSAALTAAPPLSAPQSSTSTAALAGGNVPPLDPNHELRIGGRDNASSATTPMSGGGWRSPGEVVLRGPEGANPAVPSADSPPRSEAPPAPAPTPVSGIRVTTFEQAQAMLRARGVTWQRLEMVNETNEWRFSCSIPNRQNPNLRRTYEARALDPLAAMQAALDQIDREQR